MGIQNTTPKANPAWIFTVPPARGWTRAGISLPPRGNNALQIVATSCGAGGVDLSGAYCAASNGDVEPASPCPGVALPLRAFDSCGAPSSGGGGGGGEGGGGNGPAEASGALVGVIAGSVSGAALLALAAGLALRARARARAAARAGKLLSVRAGPPRFRRAPSFGVRAVIAHTLPQTLSVRRSRP
jgi:hypothetical protein